MKNLLKIVPMLLMATCFIGCSDDEDKIVIPTIEVNYVTLHGNWMLQEWNGAELSEGIYMYITFDRSEKSFVIYQNFDSMYGRKITGTFELEKDYYKGHVITGEYDFEKGDWNNEYIITDMLESGSMVWSTNNDVSKYVRCDSIPSNIIDEATHPEF